MAEERSRKKVAMPPKAVRSMLEDEEAAAAAPLPDDYPVLPEAAPQMKIDVVVNRDRKVWVLHDKPFPSYLEWIEFDAATGEMTFVTEGGKMQNLGMIIHPPMDKYVREAREVCVMMIRNKEIRDMGMVPLTVQNKDKIGGM